MTESPLRSSLSKRRVFAFLVLPVVLILSGLALIVFVLCAEQETKSQQQSLREAYAMGAMPSGVLSYDPDPAKTPQDPEGGDQAGPEAETEEPAVLPGDPSADGEESETGEKKPLEPVCILKIPKIGLDVVVAEGTRSSVLRYAVGHFKGTALPGELGNFCLAGHRSYVSGEFFNRLDELEIGDPLIVEQYDEVFTYTVSEILVVLPEDTWVLDPTADAQITLVTCTPIRVATHRLIVKGVLEP